MITHSIVRYVASTIGMPLKEILDKPKFIAGSKEHYDYIRVKVVEQAKNNFSQGMMVKHVRGAKDHGGQIIDIHETAEDVEFHGYHCRPIEVFWWKNGETKMYHPSELEELDFGG